jgi:hypothetical protein
MSSGKINRKMSDAANSDGLFVVFRGIMGFFVLQECMNMLKIQWWPGLKFIAPFTVMWLVFSYLTAPYNISMSGFFQDLGNYRFDVTFTLYGIAILIVLVLRLVNKVSFLKKKSTSEQIKVLELFRRPSTKLFMEWYDQS